MWESPDATPVHPSPGREQNLFIGPMKHLYVRKDGTLKTQAKALDPRIPGKTLITRFVLLDADTGSVYGECHTDESKHDLAGFLARAWFVKPDHPMHGIPKRLNVPQLVRKDDNYHGDIERIVQLTGLHLGALPSGFAGGVHAVKQFDEQIRSLMWGSGLINFDATLEMAQACSAGVSNRIRPWYSGNLEARWEVIPPAPESFFAAIDKLYQKPGEWRRGAFKLVLTGLRLAASS